MRLERNLFNSFSIRLETRYLINRSSVKLTSARLQTAPVASFESHLLKCICCTHVYDEDQNFRSAQQCKKKSRHRVSNTLKAGRDRCTIDRNWLDKWRSRAPFLSKGITKMTRSNWNFKIFVNWGNQGQMSSKHRYLLSIDAFSWYSETFHQRTGFTGWAAIFLNILKTIIM